MAISKEILRIFVQEGFFNDLKSIEEVVDKFDKRGYTLKGKQISLLSQLLTYLCREGVLERERDKNGKWKYKKATKNG